MNAAIQAKDEKQVQAACVAILGWNFDPRTWRNWKSEYAVQTVKGSLPYQKLILPESVADLITVALLKKEDPHRKDLSLLKIRFERRKRGWDEWVRLLAKLDEKTMLKPCYGRELPDFIYKSLGIQVTERTLYNWGEKPGGILFDRKRQYSISEVSWWLSCAQKMPQKRKSQNQSQTIREKLYASSRNCAVA